MSKSAVALILAAAVAGCAQVPAPSGEQTPPQRALQHSSRVHRMPVTTPEQRRILSASTPSNAQLAYYGGAVISNVSVVVVFWGSGVDSTTQANIGPFYSSVTNSTYFDWLSEYNTSGLTAQDGSPGTSQSIGRGTLAGTYTITPSNTSTTLADTDIQTELDAQISAGALPPPGANSLYMTYFPPGFTITQGSSQSCVAGGFCAYHGTYNGASGEVFYGVVPDESAGSGCDTGCGSNTTFNNLTSVSSHEMIEAVTDAEVGIATGSTIGRPIAWYDANNGEIGDICNAQQGSITGGDGSTWTVQTEWSNVSNACIVSR